ncbi:MAG: hypothetical protein EBU45_05430, partial [Actinobacteria bacterium]|nr:hypothetical protein [Actinomycetota bacterium]
MPEAGLSSFEVLIVGLVRDCGKSLAQEIKTLNSAFSAFKKVSFYLVESDSKDDSLSILAELKSTIPNLDFTSLGELNSAIPDRIERIAHCRNVYLNYVKSSTNKYDYTVVADLDGVNKLLTKDGVATCWERTDWDACTANQLGPYYDVYALRANGWVERDCWNEARSLYASGLNPVKAWIKAIRSKQRVIQESNDWIEVKSAFGGLAIYKRESFIKGNTLLSFRVSIVKSSRHRGPRLTLSTAETSIPADGQSQRMANIASCFQTQRNCYFLPFGSRYLD